MEEYEYSYSDYDNNDNYEEVNHIWSKSSGGSTMKDMSGTASSPKLSARNSADDFNDVFGGPPKYIALKQLKDPKKTQTSLPSASGLAGLEVPVFGETRRRYVEDEFFNDIFNSDGETGEMSGKCCSVAASPSPAQSPLPKFIDCKAFGSRSPLGPKLRHPVNSSQKIEYSPFGAFSHCGTSKFCNDSSVVSSAHSSPSDHTIPLLDIPFGRCSRPPKQLFEAKLGLKRQQEIGVLPPRSSNSRYQPFLEPGESILETPARSSNDKLYSTAQTTCSSTPDDELGGNVHGLSRHINRRVFVEKYGSDSGKRSSSGEKEEIGFEKARLSASDVPFARHQQPPWSPPLQAFHIQNKLKSWRDWFPEPKVLHSNKESGSHSLGSAGHSSTREINTDTGTSNPLEFCEEIRPKRFSTSVDSDEESDDIGSYVIEIDTKRGETIAFLPERDIPIDTGNARNPSISSTKELLKSAKKESLPVPSRPVENFNDDAKGFHSRLQSLSQKTYDFDALGKVEAKMHPFQISKGNSRRRDSSKTTTSQHIPHKSTWPVQPPAMEHNTKESLIKELQREALHDPYSIDPSAMVKEVSSKIEKWHCEQLVVFQEMPQALERIDKAEGPSEKETPENRRKRLEKERHLRTKERVSKILVEKKKKELEAEEEQTDKAKTLEKLDNEIKRWSSGKEGNIRALLSTLQYVLWSESGWSPIPLIEIIEGAAVKKAYQKARLCVHPDKLQQKRASAQQKYIAEKVFDILQEAWAIYNSMDDF